MPSHMPKGGQQSPQGDLGVLRQREARKLATWKQRARQARGSVEVYPTEERESLVIEPHVTDEKLTNKPKPPANKVLTEAQRDRVVELRLKGASLAELAKVYACSTKTITRALASPEAQEQMRVWRMAIRRTHLERSATGLVDEMYDAAAQAAVERDYKGLDAAMRAINALEKTTFSASGEAAKVDVRGELTAHTVKPEEMREILRKLQ